MEKLELSIFIRMARLINTINSQTSHIAGTQNLTLSQFAVLEALYHKGPLPVGEVQRRILSSTGTMPVIIKNLEKRELLRREQSVTDKRQYILSLTPIGEKLISQVYPHNEKMILQEFTCLTKTEQKNLYTLLKKLTEKR